MIPYVFDSAYELEWIHDSQEEAKDYKTDLKPVTSHKLCEITCALWEPSVTLCDSTGRRCGVCLVSIVGSDYIQCRY